MYQLRQEYFCTDYWIHNLLDKTREGDRIQAMLGLPMVGIKHCGDRPTSTRGSGTYLSPFSLMDIAKVCTTATKNDTNNRSFAPLFATG